MEVFTVRSQIRDVAKRWHDEYADEIASPAYWGSHGDACVVIYNQLLALDINAATPDDVAAIIGNPTWIAPVVCNECGQTAPALIQFSIDMGEGPETFRLCADCLRRASDMLDKLDETA